MGIFTNAHQRQMGQPLMRIPGRRRHNAVRWAEGFHQFFIVAKQRGVIFIEERGDQHDQQRGDQNVRATKQYAAQRRSHRLDSDPAGNERGQNAAHPERDEHLRRQQSEGFSGRGVHHVGDHRAVDDDAVGHDEILSRCANQNENARHQAI